ncbi:MAG: hypothetical protein ACREO1_10555, partial [Arenimonas sp.]
MATFEARRKLCFLFALIQCPDLEFLMRFKIFLLLLIAMVTQSAWAEQTRNYNIGPWKYTAYVESYPYYFSGEATVDHSTEQSAIDWAIGYLNSFPQRTCSSFSFAWADDWGIYEWGDSLYGVHTEVYEKRYPRATGGQWTMLTDGSTTCSPHIQDFLVSKTRVLTCPTSYIPANGVCVAPDNVPKADNSDCPACD